MENREAPPDNPTLSPRMVKLSKFLSLLLQHHPARFPIPMDDEGFASLEEILRILKGLPNFRWAGRKDVEEVVATPGRRRFEIDSTGRRIRSLHGHSSKETPGELDPQPEPGNDEPPNR